VPGVSLELWAKDRVFKKVLELGVVAHTFNPSTREAEAGGFLSLRPAWSTK
jgi:major histocompatibility complex class I